MIALIPYWLDRSPSSLDTSDHFWWFQPISHFTTILYVGPFIPDKLWLHGEHTYICLNVHGLTWSIAEIAPKLLSNFSIRISDISLLWHVIEASSTCRVLGLEELICPSVAVVADTHHLNQPISSLVSYIRSTRYTHVTCTHNQHTPFFSATCDVDTFNFPFIDYMSNQRSFTLTGSPSLTYYGSLFSRHHFFRTKFVNRLLANSQLQVFDRLPLREWLKRISASRAQLFTCSLNGSFSFQTLYPLLYGNTLMTDPICTANWMGSLLPSIPSCFIYRNMSECVSTASFLGNMTPSHAASIQLPDATVIQSCLADFVTVRNVFRNDIINPDILPNNSTPEQHELQRLLLVLKSESGLGEVLRFIVVYERLQELHRSAWDLPISPIQVYSRKAEIYHFLFNILPAFLPRLRYPVLGGMHLKELPALLSDPAL